MTVREIRAPNFALLLALAWLAAVIQLVLTNWTTTGQTLLDTDDAMRLVEMRAWLAGQGWFDLHVSRVLPPAGFDSHWSRLIDAGLAGLYLFFHWFYEQPFAERLMRTAWPLLWLMPTIAAAAAIAWRIAGREAAVVTLLLAVIGLPAFHQFRPGRIDHHNVQIALMMLTVAATVWSDRLRWCAGAAGALTAVALAIGLESLPLLVLCGAALGLRFALTPAAGRSLSHYGWALAYATVAMFFISVGPDHWTRTTCDELAINLAAPLVAAGAALGAIGMTLSNTGRATRIAGLGLAGAVAAALFLAIEPRCIGGPYALMDRHVYPIWLAQVREMQSLPNVLSSSPTAAAAVYTFPFVALVATLWIARAGELRRDLGFLVTAAVLLTSIMIAMATVKAFSYAMWLGMPLVAVATLRLYALLRLENVVARFLVAALLTPSVLTAGTITATAAAANIVGYRVDTDAADDTRHVCFQSASYAPIAKLPAGVVATEIDFGPFILALTPHAVLAAPYHRTPEGIMTVHRAFAAPPDRAREILAAAGATYIAMCGNRGPMGITYAERAVSLWGRLHARRVPDWLEPVPGPAEAPFTLYRLRQ